MAEQAVVAYLKSLLNNILTYLNNIKKKMLAYIQQQQAISMVDGLLKDMQKSGDIVHGLLVSGNSVSQKTLYNSNITNYNIDLATLNEIKEDAVFGDFNIDKEVQKFFSLNLSDLIDLSTI